MFMVSLIVWRHCFEKWAAQGTGKPDWQEAISEGTDPPPPYSPSLYQGRGGEQRMFTLSILTLDEVDKQNGQDVEREPQDVEEGQGDEGGFGV